MVTVAGVAPLGHAGHSPHGESCTISNDRLRLYGLTCTRIVKILYIVCILYAVKRVAHHMLRFRFCVQLYIVPCMTSLYIKCDSAICAFLYSELSTFHVDLLL